MPQTRMFPCFCGGASERRRTALSDFGRCGLTLRPSPDCFLGDPDVGIGYMDAVCCNVVETFVRVNARRTYVPEKLDRLELRPRRVFLREIVTRRQCREAENPARSSEDVNLHVFYQ